MHLLKFHLTGMLSVTRKGFHLLSVSFRDQATITITEKFAIEVKLVVGKAYERTTMNDTSHFPKPGCPLLSISTLVRKIFLSKRNFF